MLTHRTPARTATPTGDFTTSAAGTAPATPLDRRLALGTRREWITHPEINPTRGVSRRRWIVRRIAAARGPRTSLTAVILVPRSACDRRQGDVTALVASQDGWPDGWNRAFCARAALAAPGDWRPASTHATAITRPDCRVKPPQIPSVCVGKQPDEQRPPRAPAHNRFCLPSPLVASDPSRSPIFCLAIPSHGQIASVPGGQDDPDDCSSPA